MIIALGCIPVAPYGTPGTQELSDALEPMVQHYDAILLANHGVVTCGPDLLTAFFRMETLEHFAQVSLMTEMLGKQVLLSGRDVEKLLLARARYGTTTAAHRDSRVSSHERRRRNRRATLRNAFRLPAKNWKVLIEEAVRKDRALR